jgi:hypothetical protein
MIGTVRQVGYKFVVPPTRQLAEPVVEDLTEYARNPRA